MKKPPSGGFFCARGRSPADVPGQDSLCGRGNVCLFRRVSGKCAASAGKRLLRAAFGTILPVFSVFRQSGLFYAGAGGAKRCCGHPGDGNACPSSGPGTSVFGRQEAAAQKKESPPERKARAGRHTGAERGAAAKL